MKPSEICKIIETMTKEQCDAVWAAMTYANFQGSMEAHAAPGRIDMNYAQCKQAETNAWAKEIRDALRPKIS
jgi:hypothetical protein